ncbi:hypothetical protein [Nocardia sp. NPDC005825]|uniref:hypothetical protein n=1 Tax=unclassified Nocardia TaxID=2637762 RepID=UPI0033E8EB6B
MSKQLYPDLRRPAAGATAAVALAVVAGSMLAAPANASIDGVQVAGLTSDKPCSVADGCVIQAALGGADQLTPVDFLVNGAVIGTLTPVSYGAGAAANLAWHPANDGTYTVGVRQGLSTVQTVYIVGKGGTCPPISSLIPGSSGGSAGTGSGGSGSAGSGSATGSGDSGSGTGSGGSGSNSGSNQPLPAC